MSPRSGSRAASLAAHPATPIYLVFFVSGCLFLSFTIARVLLTLFAFPLAVFVARVLRVGRYGRP